MRAMMPWRNLACLIAVIAAALAVNFWTLNVAHYFYADDWGWLERAAFDKWTDIFHIFPQSIYNDRPAGFIFIFLMYRLFGLDSHPYNVLWLLLHIINCAVFFSLARRILPTNRALIAAIVAAAWCSTLIAVHWVGAIFDLAGATWCLLCVLFYIQSSNAVRWNKLLLVTAAALTHFLAIRCKEFALALIVVLTSWEFLVIKGQSFNRRLIRLVPHILITVVFGLIYLRLYRLDEVFVSKGAYKLTFSLSTCLDNAAYYVSQAFYIQGHSYLILGYVLLIALVVLGFTSRAALAGLISAIALMAAVLVMPNQHNTLYLYAPHFFIALTLCSIKPRTGMATALTVLLALVLLGWPFYSHQWEWSKNFYLQKGAYSFRLMKDYVRDMKGEPVPSEVTIGVAQPYFDPFSWAQGAALRLYYADREITVKIIKLSANSVDPCTGVVGICLVEKNGHLILHQ